jgi:ribonuclease Z
LGANSATPMSHRFPSSFVLNYSDHLYLIDCGEGSQIKMSQFGVKRSRINHIFISHLHGDHIFGLPGFINSLNLNGRKDPLEIFGPVGLQDYLLTIFRLTAAHVSFEIIFHELESPTYQRIAVDGDMEIFAFPLKHRILTFGYLFIERKKEYKLNPLAIDQYQLTVEEMKMAKLGKSINRLDLVIKNEDLTLPKVPDKSFAYCSDTIYDEEIIPYITGANTLYHEATYLHDLADQARQRMHATADEAARIAHMAAVNTLIIGHYSSRYKNLQPLVDEARAVFPNTHLALEGQHYTIQ